MKKVLSILFVTGLFLAACTASKTSGPADQSLDESIFTQAIDGGNLARCKDILDSTMKAECTQVVQDKATTNEAVSAVDKSKCSKVTNERYRKECETQVDVKLTAKNADTKRLTIEQKALEKGDAGICDEINDLNQKGACKYNVLADQALQKKDPSLCDEIGLKSMIEDCKNYLKK